MIVFHNCQSIIQLNKLKTARMVNAMIIAAGYPKWYGYEMNYNCRNLTVSYIEDEKMRDLNHHYRKKDSSTDILSFPTHTVGTINDTDVLARFNTRNNQNDKIYSLLE